MLPFFFAAIGVIVTVLLAIGAVASQSLTPWAGTVAAAFGSVIVVIGGFAYLALLVLFVIAGGLATRYSFEEKQSRNVQEGVHGERGVANVLAHILVPTTLVLLPFLFPWLLAQATMGYLYTAALAFGASDTFASEFGVLAGPARSILNGRKVPAGTNGGISVAGEVWAAVGAFTTALVGLSLFLLFHAPRLETGLAIAGVTGAGFLACQVDSVLGETLENRGWLTKGSTNLVAMISSVLVASGIYLLVA